MIDEEIAKAQQGEPAYIGIKINSLTDKKIMDRLIRASKEGVRIDMIVRGICCLVPGIPDMTENIRIISIVGRYLEHSRVYIFGTEETQKVYIASADFMTRNTIHRVEVAAPVYDVKVRKRILDMFRIMLSDNVQARQMQPDGNYIRLEAGSKKAVNSQETFYAQTGSGQTSDEQTNGEQEGEH